MNILKRAYNFGIVLTCILSGFMLYNCAAQPSMSQQPPLTTEAIVDQEVEPEEHLRAFNSWDLRYPDRSEKIKAAIKRIQEAPDSPLVDKALAHAYTLQMDGKIAEATEKWHAIANIAAEIDNAFAARVLLSVGHLLQKDNKDTEALPVYDEAIRLMPKYSKAYYHRAMLKEVLRKREEAVSDYETAIAGYDETLRLDPSNVNAYLYRGRVKTRLEQYDAALTDFNEAIRLDPDDVRFYVDRGFAQLNLGQYDSALTNFDKALQLVPNYIDAYRGNGLVKQDLKQYDAALTDFDKAIELEPDDASAYNHRGLVKQDLKQYDAALADYDKAIALEPDDAGAYNNRGLVKQ